MLGAQLIRARPWLILAMVVLLAACGPGSTAPGY
jgi:hypothetical protein